MKLTKVEKAICRVYSRRGANGLVRCRDCPLVISRRDCLCYANIDDDAPEVEGLTRFVDDDDDTV
jgi:hypothetical protein